MFLCLYARVLIGRQKMGWQSGLMVPSAITTGSVYAYTTCMVVYHNYGHPPYPWGAHTPVTMRVITTRLTARPHPHALRYGGARRKSGVVMGRGLGGMGRVPPNCNHLGRTRDLGYLPTKLRPHSARHARCGRFCSCALSKSRHMQSGLPHPATRMRCRLNQLDMIMLPSPCQRCSIFHNC